MTWSAVVQRVTPAGGAQEVSVVLSDGVQKFTQSVMHDGTLASLTSALRQLVAGVDFRATVKSEVLAGQVIDLAPPAPTPPPIDPLAPARDAFGSAWALLQSYQRASDAGLPVTAALANARAVAVKAYDPAFDALL